MILILVLVSAREIEIKVKCMIFYLCRKFTKAATIPYWNYTETSSSIKEYAINNSKWNSITEVIDEFSVRLHLNVRRALPQSAYSHVEYLLLVYTWSCVLTKTKPRLQEFSNFFVNSPAFKKLFKFYRQ